MAAPRKKRTSVITPKPYPVGSGSNSSVRETSGDAVGQELARRVRGAGAYTVGDQIPPAAILWPDGEKRWAGLLPALQALIPELYAMGPLAPAVRTGPAIWLRCVEARAITPAVPQDRIPIFYLPGVSRHDLRAVEECPAELEPLIELQFRGAVWSHPNGKDWTPFAFLTSVHGGLGLDVAGDSDTASALDRALAALLNEQVAALAGERIDAAYLNMLLAPDLPVEILRWMTSPAEAKSRKTAPEWQAFCSQCVADYHLHPDKDGELRAAALLGNRESNWIKVWKRFAEAPQRYPGVVELLERAAPPTDGMLPLDREYWPGNNAADEAALGKALLALKDKHAADAAKTVLDLERAHGSRRDWVWREVGRAPLAVALEPLSLLATLTAKALAGADANSMAEQYVQSAWETDAAAMAALASGSTAETDEAIATAVRALYLPWLDMSARNLQSLAAKASGDLKPRRKPVEADKGRVILFVDGLRFDMGQRLARHLRGAGIQPDVDWDWAAFPTVTPTGKTAASPMASGLVGGGPEEEFAPNIAATGQRWTTDRFRAFLKEQGVQNLQGRDCGDPTGSAWAETGTLDSRGHNEGAKASKTLDQEVKDAANRGKELLDAGWREVVVVTDHGWLLVPGGLPKVNLSHFIVEHRWGRCAAVKTLSSTALPAVPWYWNHDVTIATPPGAGCFRAGLEYAHGGLSVQEMVVPRITIRAGAGSGSQARISGVKWVGLRCRVSVQNPTAGLLADLRGRPADAESSKVEGGQPREVGSDGTVSLPVGDDRETGSAAVVVLLSPEGTLAHSLPTVVGENS